ncbi:MAG TPA: threonine ammonia-lyase [Trebonia sp.]|nr:threonine ammonia-lyase [Trebonia sp.]
MASISPLVQPDDIVAARELLSEVISPTPVLYSRVLSELAGGPVYLKCENLQRTGSFKVRGAYTRIARMSDTERARGVVAASAGNHAQGVAFAAGLLGASATVVMPERAPLPKVAATVGYGAKVILHGATVEDALAEALRFAARTGAMFIHPFDHQDIVAGQGTLGFEIIEQCPQVRTILIPVGGGGLAAGVTVAVHSLDPEVKIVGVQAAAVPGLIASMAEGHPVQCVGEPTMADGIAVQRPGDIPFSILAWAADRIVSVSEAALARGLLLCLERAKQVVEPAGAAGVAALLAEPGAFEPPVVVVLSGGNIDPLLLSKLLRHGLSAAGRFLGFRCRVPDYPGSLATLLGLVAELGGNVLEVSHERLAPTLRVDEVEVVLQVETRGPEHCELVKDGLRAAGYDLAFS